MCLFLTKLTFSLLIRYFTSNTSPQVLIRRSVSRRFTEQKGIEEAMKRVAADFNLTFNLFPDNPTPPLNATMTLFHSAVIVVGPVGAGESNILFSRPGTYVVEGVCNVPHVNLCFQRLAYILGHHWHGIASRGGCENSVSVSITELDTTVRKLLHLRQNGRG